MTEHTPSSGLGIVAVGSIDAIGRDNWNRFAGTANPLVSYDFLEALEASGSVSADTGWQPCHLKPVPGR